MWLETHTRKRLQKTHITYFIVYLLSKDVESRTVVIFYQTLWCLQAWAVYLYVAVSVLFMVAVAIDALISVLSLNFSASPYTTFFCIYIYVLMLDNILFVTLSFDKCPGTTVVSLVHRIIFVVLLIYLFIFCSIIIIFFLWLLLWYLNKVLRARVLTLASAYALPYGSLPDPRCVSTLWLIQSI